MGRVIVIHCEESCALMIIHLVYVFGELDVPVMDENGIFFKHPRISIL